MPFIRNLDDGKDSACFQYMDDPTIKPPNGGYYER